MMRGEAQMGATRLERKEEKDCNNSEERGKDS